MKKLLILITFISSLIYADCNKIQYNRWICKDTVFNNETNVTFNTVTILDKRNDVFWFRTYLPEQKNIQTEKVRISKSSMNELKEDYINTCSNLMYSVGKNKNISFEDCNSACIDLWNVGSNDNSYDMILFMVKNGRTNIHSVYCMGYNYVRTYDYDRYTQLEINRKDYHNLPIKSYCTEFLTKTTIQFSP